MRKLLTIAMVLCLVGVAAASDLGNQAPVKPAIQSICPPADPSLQGGDTIFDAFPIATVMPQFHDTGTTVGYVNDYDAICPFSGSTAPDVVYSYVAEAGVTSVTVSLCYSSYDTKVYMYDSSLNLIACNDDFYFDAPCYVYSSAVENVPVTTGQTYYIIVDGYFGASGAYDIVVTPGAPPCDFTCPTPNTPEGEPALVDGYVDNYDGGCNSAGFPFMDLTEAPDDFGNLTLCGGSGWYVGPNGGSYRDTDWYYLKMGTGGAIDITVDAAQPTYIFELGPQDCANVAVIQNVIGGDCLEAYMTITGYGEGSIVWFWAGPTDFVSPDGSSPFNYEYACWFTGLFPGIVATQDTNWSTMKAIFE
jgi:hypothetical protein